MKVVYEKPVMDVQCFMANEFCSACGDQNKVYKFECDAPAGKVYQETNKRDGLQTSGGFLYKADKCLTPGYSRYDPCGEKHEAAGDGEFLRGYVLPFDDSKGDCLEVMIWTGENRRNVHCTTHLDMDAWETGKS